jgi:hypothetical protein|nr:MAG TPA: hypothetical protein [Caudoviricetes sp.]
MSFDVGNVSFWQGADSLGDIKNSFAREAEVSFLPAMKIATKVMAVHITNNFT